MRPADARLFCRVALRLPDLRSVRPAVNLFTIVAETAGAGGLNIAEMCAPCAMSDITQKKYWERNLPGINTEAVALPDAARTGKYSVVTLFRRVAAAPYPAYRIHSQAHTP
ncbi:hypothetical protein BV370_13070 [Klebsiella pneumoniae]|nr:hypothetical protein BV370_13070 [Klebsiella pneumoniae]